jgi:ribA/ribD-fused uncharacterized protein
MNNLIPFTSVALPYGWMGNMAPYPLNFENRVWRTSEALFQAMRFENEELSELIRSQTSPMAAKMKAKSNRNQMILEPHSGEDLDNMRLVIDLKFGQHPTLAEMLIKTGNSYIYENVEKRKSKSGLFWGAIFDNENNMRGQNQLGLILMEKRAALMGA